ncbi:hypothetical protein GDO78_005352 [Eleutherodactylus coqui]|uniref:Uncharacterized protein n=1 Tax=Eleutherodactylus coqui TaxID=57060 RepID=A0A8J6FJU2_ELECQ|nr:hypothetical protein GDO78_005352 [Eleutherodactylus coqui]
MGLIYHQHRIWKHGMAQCIDKSSFCCVNPHLFHIFKFNVCLETADKYCWETGLLRSLFSTVLVCLLNAFIMSSCLEIQNPDMA